MRRILAAVDHSPLAYSIMTRGVELATLTHSELTLLSVINENPLLTSSIAEEQAKLKALHQDLVYRNFSKDNVKIETNPVQGISFICAGPTVELRIRSRIENGNPIDVICGCSDQIDADLVIIGNRGLGEIGALIGSVSEKIVRKSNHSVLVVKSEASESADFSHHESHASKT